VAASKLPGLPEDEGYRANSDDEELI